MEMILDCVVLQKTLDLFVLHEVLELVTFFVFFNNSIWLVVLGYHVMLSLFVVLLVTVHAAYLEGFIFTLGAFVLEWFLEANVTEIACLFFLHKVVVSE